jgi:hypothetical protein
MDVVQRSEGSKEEDEDVEKLGGQNSEEDV